MDIDVVLKTAIGLYLNQIKHISLRVDLLLPRHFFLFYLVAVI